MTVPCDNQTAVSRRKEPFHRFRKTYADTLHEEGVSVNTIRIRLGHESLDLTLAYLKGKDAESEEAQEHANSRQPGAARLKPKNIVAGDF